VLRSVVAGFATLYGSFFVLGLLIVALQYISFRLGMMWIGGIWPEAIGYVCLASYASPLIAKCTYAWANTLSKHLNSFR